MEILKAYGYVILMVISACVVAGLLACLYQTKLEHNEIMTWGQFFV